MERRLGFISHGLDSTQRCSFLLPWSEPFVSFMDSSPMTTTSGGKLHQNQPVLLILEVLFTKPFKFPIQ